MMVGVDTNGASDASINPSRARDHMANERTYLAWLRTAANVMVVGLVLANLTAGRTTRAASLASGAILVTVGASGVICATVRYRQVNHELESGQYVTGSRGRGPTWASAVLLVAILAALALLLAGGRN